MNDDPDNIIHRLTHITFNGWDENKLPLPASEDELAHLLLQLSNSLKKDHFANLLNKNQNPSKVLIHSKAGTGRTGIFIALINAVQQAQE